MDREDVVHIYNGILLRHKRNEIMPFAATWMELEIIILSEISQTEKDKYHMISHICEILKKKKDTNELIYRTETDHRQRKQTYGYQRGNVGGGRVEDKLGVWD